MAVNKAPRKRDDVAELATQLLASLQAKKAQGDYPLTLRRLAESVHAGPSGELLSAAVGKTQFTKSAFLVKPADKKKGASIDQVMDSPVALWEDAERVACHPSTLDFVRAALPQGTTADWKKYVNAKAEFKKPFAAMLDSRFGPEAVANALLDTLRKSRQSPASERLLTLRRLVEMAGMSPTPETLAKAIASKPFTEAAFLVKPPGKDYSVERAVASPAALWEEAEELAAMPAVLDFVRRECPGGQSQWKKWVCGKPRKDFQVAFARVLETRLPRRLIEVLRVQKRLGQAAYPLTLRRLAELADRTPEADVAEAIPSEAFRQTAIVAAPRQKKVKTADLHALMEASVALRDDVDLLAGTPEFLEKALAACRTEKSNAFTIDEIVKALLSWDAALSQRFAYFAAEKLKSGSISATVAWIRKNGKQLLFLVEDSYPGGRIVGKLLGQGQEGKRAEPVVPAGVIRPEPSPATAANVAPSPDALADRFAARFDEAFSRLDRENGSYNFVSLVDLRRALPEYSRDQFDRGLKSLRQARRYRINVGEGRSGVSPEQQAAAIIEDGTIHSSVSKVKS